MSWPHRSSTTYARVLLCGPSMWRGGGWAGDLRPFCKVMHTLHICLSSMNACYGGYNPIVAVSWNIGLWLPSKCICPPSLLSPFSPLWIPLISYVLAKWLRLKYLFISSFFFRVSKLAHLLLKRKPSPFKTSPKYRCPSNLSVAGSFIQHYQGKKCCQMFQCLMGH